MHPRPEQDRCHCKFNLRSWTRHGVRQDELVATQHQGQGVTRHNGQTCLSFQQALKRHVGAKSPDGMSKSCLLHARPLGATKQPGGFCPAVL